MSWVNEIKRKAEVDVLPHNALYHPTIEDLTYHYVGKPSYMNEIAKWIWRKPVKKELGGSNETFFQNSERHGRLAFRISQEPIFTYETRPIFDRIMGKPSQEYLNLSSNITSQITIGELRKANAKRVEGDKKIIKNYKVDQGSRNQNFERHYDGSTILFDLLNRTENNWLEANKKEICPKILFYGYIKQQTKTTVELKSCIICEAYDGDLASFYDELESSRIDASEKKKINEIVCQQLVQLISDYVDLGIVCSDIKPNNAVIKKLNTDKGIEYMVKLIDLDGDYCRTPDGLVLTSDRILRSHPREKDNYKILLNIIMANHFFYYYNRDVDLRNVFISYFETIPDLHTEKKRDELKSLFYNNEHKLSQMCQNYFIEMPDDDNITRGYVETSIAFDDDEFFKLLFENVIPQELPKKSQNRHRKELSKSSSTKSRSKKKRPRKGGYKNKRTRKYK